jgi:hypothetical protein
VAAIGALAREKGLHFHMDGARFANAVAHLDCSPSAASVEGGVDALSFGFVKNGGMSAEALVFFAPDMIEATRFRRKRAGHLQSKGRYLAAQILAMLKGDLWLNNARHANAAAGEIAAAAADRLIHPVEANEVFIALNGGNARPRAPPVLPLRLGRHRRPLCHRMEQPAGGSAGAGQSPARFMSGAIKGGALASFAIVSLIWGSTWLVIKDQIAFSPPGWTVTWRFIIAAIGMAGWRRFAASLWPCRGGRWGWRRWSGFSSSAPISNWSIAPRIMCHRALSRCSMR